MQSNPIRSTVIFSLPLIAISYLQPVLAQNIQPAHDGTGTIVTPAGQQLQIQGGRTSHDRRNLFHSFQRFNVETGQTANFLAPTETRNILGRIVGGETSLINGLLQITGANANLFLINPAGIIFGPNASLNLPAAFTVTTATGINFAQGTFNIFSQQNDYQNLIGNPSGFNFSADQTGAIINQANLSLLSEENLLLLGGAVVNTGTLHTAGGHITLASIPGSNTVRLSQTGHLLSLDLPFHQINPSDDSIRTSVNLPDIQSLTLPQLLTGNTTSANNIAINEQGQIALTVKSGETIASGKINTSNPQAGMTGGTINILGKTVQAIGSEINVSGDQGGGMIRLGGDYRGLGDLPKSQITLIDSSTNILADAINQGDGGNIFIWSEGATKFAGNISAKGGQILGNGGFAEISSKGNLMYRGQVDLSAINGNYGNLLLDPENIIIVAGTFADDDFQIDDNQILAGEGIGTFTISEGALEGLSGNANVILEATNNITVESLTDGILGFNVGTGEITFLADADLDGAGNFTMNTGEIQTRGRNISIQGASVTVNDINTRPINSEAAIKSGNINLTASNGNIIVNNIDVSSDADQAGVVNLLADAVQLGGINAGGEISGGNVTITANTGDINIRDFIVTTANTANGGNISLEAGGNITINGANSTNINELDPNDFVALDSSSIQNQGGTIDLQADGNIQVDSVIRSGALNFIFNNEDITGTGQGNTITLLSLKKLPQKQPPVMVEIFL